MRDGSLLARRPAVQAIQNVVAVAREPENGSFLKCILTTPYIYITLSIQGTATATC
jgi:hypothetical protein